MEKARAGQGVACARGLARPCSPCPSVEGCCRRQERRLSTPLVAQSQSAAHRRSSLEWEWEPRRFCLIRSDAPVNCLALLCSFFPATAGCTTEAWVLGLAGPRAPSSVASRSPSPPPSGADRQRLATAACVSLALGSVFVGNASSGQARVRDEQQPRAETSTDGCIWRRASVLLQAASCNGQSRVARLRIGSRCRQGGNDHKPFNPLPGDGERGVSGEGKLTRCIAYTLIYETDKSAVLNLDRDEGIYLPER